MRSIKISERRCVAAGREFAAIAAVDRDCEVRLGCPDERCRPGVRRRSLEEDEVPEVFANDGSLEEELAKWEGSSRTSTGDDDTALECDWEISARGLCRTGTNLLVKEQTQYSFSSQKKVNIGTYLTTLPRS